MGARIVLLSDLDFPDRLYRGVFGGLGALGRVEDAEAIARALRGGKPETPAALTFQQFAAARPTNDLEALAACMEGLGRSGRVDSKRLAEIWTPILLVARDLDDLAPDAPKLATQLPTPRLCLLPRPHPPIPAPSRP